MRRHPALVLFCLVIVLVSAMVGCSAAPVPPAKAKVPSRDLHTPTKVLTIVEENHTYSQMLDQMPYLSYLAHQYGYATNYFAIAPDSLQNYLAMTGGSTFGTTDNLPPAVNSPKVGDARSIFDQALALGKTAKTYAESMDYNCQPTNDGQYVVRHNPWPYFSAGGKDCQRYDVLFQQLATDVENNDLPNVGMVIPNLCNDAHSCDLDVADEWLKSHLPAVLASRDFITGRLVVIVTADEDDGSAGGHVLTVVMHASLHGKVVSTRFDHYSLLGYYEHVMGAPLLRNAKRGFAAAFGL